VFGEVAQTIATTTVAAKDDRRSVRRCCENVSDLFRDSIRASTCRLADYAYAQAFKPREAYIFLTTISGLPNHA
jgi:hypothetical protein